MASPPASSSLTKTIALLLGVASMGLAGFAVWMMLGPGQGKGTRVASSSANNYSSSSTPAGNETRTPWVASAPGRVEPRSGLVRISAGSIGRVKHLPVRLNDKVSEGQLLLVQDDKEARARLLAAEAQAAATKRDRDAAPATQGRENINRAEDAVYNAERAVTAARMELDDLMLAEGRANAQAITSARKRLTDAQERLRQESSSLSSLGSRAGLTAPNRLEAGLAAARAEVMLADQAWDRTRLRAPAPGTVLQINAKVGETLAPSPEQVVFVMGDVSRLRVRAEVDDTEIGKVRLNQSVFVKSSTFPGQEFEGKVVEIAPFLSVPRMPARGPRRPSDVEVLEVVVDLDGSVTLMPGMRADVFFR
ncbi:MAG: efflux RND transporter periplasmic adaptor subunit [Hyphomicrobiaceae bacterium]|nr:efflux RND transporter periplasmic adaptor subunit [Hyphomicrobiaceae bacterium]